MKSTGPGILLLIVLATITFTDFNIAGADTLADLHGFTEETRFSITDVRGSARAITRYSYMSGDLRVMCEVVFPQTDIENGLPVLVLCHGGIEGISNRMRVKSLELADLGYLVVMPSYRGEDGSDGEIEIAVGEVDDVLACVDLLRQSEKVDGRKIAIVGSSHGALIAAFAAARDPGLCAVVCAYGVMDIHTWWNYLLENEMHDWEDEISRRIYGDGPEDRPEEFEKRSGLRVACEIFSPVMIVQGDSDRLVPKSQALAMRDAFERCSKPNFFYNEYAGVGHGFIWFTENDAERRGRDDVDTAYKSWDDILEFIKNCRDSGDS